MTKDLIECSGHMSEIGTRVLPIMRNGNLLTVFFEEIMYMKFLLRPM